MPIGNSPNRVLAHSLLYRAHGRSPFPNRVRDEKAALASLGMMIHHTNVAKAKVAVTLDAGTLEQLDRLVAQGRFANRSQAIESAIEATLRRFEHRRLAEECAKLDPDSEQALAELGLNEDAATWPRY